jgi:phosphatidylserine decarboxylase
MLARGMTPYIFVFIFITAIFAFLGQNRASMAMLLFTLLFFIFNRDPNRTPLGDGMVAPADGRIAEATPGRVAIFMSLYNVHVNRSPLEGFVKEVLYRRGGHTPAFCKSTEKNERNVIVIETADGLVHVQQIAGAIARKIVCYVKPGDHVKRGERIGMIRLGSRVEVTIPNNYEIQVKINDKVRAGETIIAVERI